MFELSKMLCVYMKVFCAFVTVRNFICVCLLFYMCVHMQIHIYLHRVPNACTKSLRFSRVCLQVDHGHGPCPVVGECVAIIPDLLLYVHVYVLVCVYMYVCTHDRSHMPRPMASECVACVPMLLIYMHV
jgi:hypothetical protein